MRALFQSPGMLREWQTAIPWVQQNRPRAWDATTPRSAENSENRLDWKSAWSQKECSLRLIEVKQRSGDEATSIAVGWN